MDYIVPTEYITIIEELVKITAQNKQSILEIIQYMKSINVQFIAQHLNFCMTFSKSL